MTLILILRPNFHNHLTPLGYLYVATVLKKNGFPVKVLDLNMDQYTDEEVYQEIQKYKVKQVIIGTSYKFHNNCPSSTIRGAFAYASKVKAIDKTIKTTLIGPLNSVLEDKLLDNPYVDFVVHGEPEECTLELTEKINEADNDFENIKGLGFRNGKDIISAVSREYPNLKKMPFPDRSFVNMENYFFNTYYSRRVTCIITTRGCPNRCSYCFAAIDSKRNALNKGRYYRTHDPDKVVEEIVYLVDKYKIHGFRIEDIEFCVHKAYVQELCNKIIEAKLNYLKWRCVARADTVDEDLLRIMKNAGCVSVYYGVEFGDQGILEKSNKKIRIEEIQKTFELTRKTGIQADSSFLFGMPGETRYTINKSVKLAIKLNPGVSTFHVLAPYMGTTLLNNIKNKEDINIDDFDVYTGSSSGFSCCDLSSNELKRLSNLAYLKFYLRPSYLLKLLIRLRESDFRCFVYDAILGVKEAGWVRNLLFPNLGRMRKP